MASGTTNGVSPAHGASYALTDRSKKNAGDYLIHKRARELIMREKKVDSAALTTMTGWRRVNPDRVNAHRALIVCGGPALAHNFYPTIYPLTNNLKRIRVPIFLLGVGAPALKPSLESLHLSEASLGALRHICSNGGAISVRDPLTQELLERYNIYSSVTGCPVYFHPTETAQPKLPGPSPRILFTPGPLQLHPSFTRHQNDLLQGLTSAYPSTTVSFHRGRGENLNTNGVKVIDVTGGADKMEQYSNYDVHVGYRVHAHIWFVSTGRPSFLIPSDVRGIGANRLLDLPFQHLWSKLGVLKVLATVANHGLDQWPLLERNQEKLNSLREMMSIFVGGMP
jgi:polysaccharide pyruvyl transferase WcaK-like protein